MSENIKRDLGCEEDSYLKALARKEIDHHHINSNAVMAMSCYILGAQVERHEELRNAGILLGGPKVAFLDDPDNIAQANWIIASKLLKTSKDDNRFQEIQRLRSVLRSAIFLSFDVIHKLDDSPISGEGRPFVADLHTPKAFKDYAPTVFTSDKIRFVPEASIDTFVEE